MNAHHLGLSIDTHSLIIWLIVGAIAGWLAGVLNIHVGTGIIATIITATVGAAVLILLLRLVRRA